MNPAQKIWQSFRSRVLTGRAFRLVAPRASFLPGSPGPGGPSLAVAGEEHNNNARLLKSEGMARRLVVFSDLDGTLLDHDTYDWRPAQKALDALRERDIPLVLCSSKTAAEMAVLRDELGLTTPYISENGAVLEIPAGNLGATEAETVMLGEPRQKLLDALAQLRKDGFRFLGFSDMTERAVAEATGLDLESAARARQRIATEPLLWRSHPSEVPAFEKALSALGLQLLQGGRFYHVMGQFDKADAMRELLRRYRAFHEADRVSSIALGDGPNDQKMLQFADIAVVIKGVKSAQITLSNKTKVVYSPKPGPVGWNNCVLEILAGFER